MPTGRARDGTGAGVEVGRDAVGGWQQQRHGTSAVQYGTVCLLHRFLIIIRHQQHSSATRKKKDKFIHLLDCSANAEFISEIH